MIQSTRCDLELRFQKIADRFDGLQSPTEKISNQMLFDPERITEEKESIKRCLDICSRVSNHIDNLHPGAPENDLDTTGRSTSALMNCRGTLEDTSYQLRNHLRLVDEHLSSAPEPPILQSSHDIEDRKRLLEERSSLLNSIKLYDEAAKEANRDRKNVYEDITMAEDGCQILVSTVGELITAHNIVAGPRSTQVLGQISDESLQQISRDHQAAYLQHPSEENKAWLKNFKMRHGTERYL